MTRKKQVMIQKTAKPIMPPDLMEEPVPMTLGMVAIEGVRACSMT